MDIRAYARALLVLSENDIKLRGNENFTVTKNNRTNLVDRA